MKPSKVHAVRQYRSNLKAQRSLSVKQDTRLLSLMKNTDKPLSIEIGAGAGLHTVRLHKDYSYGGRYIGFERTKEKFSKLESRLKQHQLLQESSSTALSTDFTAQKDDELNTNLCILNYDAEAVLPFYLTPSSVDVFYMLYPNPYPKESQSNKRWHRTPFMHFLLSSLKDGGYIELATNEKFYFDEALDYFQNYWQLRVISSPVAFCARPRTHFEKKYLLRGQTCYNLRAYK